MVSLNLNDEFKKEINKFFSEIKNVSLDLSGISWNDEVGSALTGKAEEVVDIALSKGIDSFSGLKDISIPECEIDVTKIKNEVKEIDFSDKVKGIVSWPD